MRSRFAALLLSVAALAIGLAHVCSSPDAAHAGTVAGSHTDATHDDAIDAASCEAVLPALATYDVPMVPASVTFESSSSHSVRETSSVARAVVPASSPPLFLLHASLLI